MSNVRAVGRLIADAKKKNRAFKEAMKAAGIVIPRGEPDPVDPAAMRAAIRKAAVEAEVERRIAASPDRWLRQAELEKITGLRRTALWTLRREDPTFPKPERPTGGRAIRFRESDVQRWMAARQRTTKTEA